MGSWSISWKFSKSSYSPGELATVSFWLRNTGSTYLCLSELELIFDFGTYKLGSLCNVIPPGTNKFLGSVNLSLPKNVAGRKVFTIKYHIYEQIDKKWIDRGNYQSDKSYILNIYPKPFYKVFVSKGLRSEDRTISDPIVEMIKEWGFETKTVGDEIKVPDDQALSKIREEIRNADALIVIATPRYMDALTGVWKTLEWIHAEVAFGIDKPLLILKDKRVSMGGLPSYLEDYGKIPVIEFDPYKLDELKTKLSSVMPGFREWIETARNREFFDALGKVALGIVSAALVVGTIGTIFGGS